jgi:hypothetical protein
MDAIDQRLKQKLGIKAIAGRSQLKPRVTDVEDLKNQNQSEPEHLKLFNSLEFLDHPLNGA